MTTYVLRNDRFVLKGGPEDIRPERARSHLPAPFVISDAMHGGVRSMLDGKEYDSKSALRASYRAAGVEEMGNDAPTAAPVVEAPPSMAEIHEAVTMVEQGYKPGPLPVDIIPESAS
jgi:hypothetical protein